MNTLQVKQEKQIENSSEAKTLRSALFLMQSNVRILLRLQYRMYFLPSDEANKSRPRSTRNRPNNKPAHSTTNCSQRHS